MTDQLRWFTRIMLNSVELLFCVFEFASVALAMLIVASAAWDWPKNIMILMVLPLLVGTTLFTSLVVLLFGVLSEPAHRWSIGIGAAGIAVAGLAVFAGLALDTSIN